MVKGHDQEIEKKKDHVMGENNANITIDQDLPSQIYKELLIRIQ